MMDWIFSPAMAATLQDVPPDAGIGGLIVFLILAITGGLIFLKVKQPALFDRIMHAGKDVAGSGFEMTKEIKHTVGPLFDGIKSKCETKLHHFEENTPARAPAIAPTPTSEAMRLAAKLAKLKEDYKLTDEQIGRIIFGGESPPAVVQQVETPKPKFINGIMQP